MTDRSKNAPVKVIRDGALKATIWENEGENGAYFSTTLSRTFEQNGEWRDGQSFSATDLLKIVELARHAYHAIWQKRQAERAAQRQSEDRGNDLPAPSNT